MIETNHQRAEKLQTHLYDGVHGTRLLAEATVDAFGHVDVVASRPPAAVGTSLRLNGDGLERDMVGGEEGDRAPSRQQAYLCAYLGGADGFAQLAGDAALLS